MKKSTRYRFRHLFFLLAVTVAVLLILFVATEATMRLSAHYLLQTMNDRSFTEASKPSDYLIACFGDSVTVGIGTTDQNLHSYPAQLEQFLQQRYPNARIQVLNEGIAGSNSSDTMERIRKQFKTYQRPPDLMIVMTSNNNMWNMHVATPLQTGSASLPKSKRWLARLETTRVGKLAVVAGLRGAELVNHLIKTEGTRNNHMRWRGENDKYICLLNPSIQEERAFLKTWLTQDLKEMKKFSMEHDTPILIGMYHMSEMNLLIQQVAERAEIPVCNPAGKGNFFWKFSGLISDDGWHPNDKGYTIIAHNYLECISTSGLGPAMQ